MYLKILPAAYGGFLLMMSLVALILFATDKAMAGRGTEARVKEKTLLAVTVYGGGVGALFGRILFRHKTRKFYFSMVIALSVLVQMAVFIFLLLRAGGIVE